MTNKHWIALALGAGISLPAFFVWQRINETREFEHTQEIVKEMGVRTATADREFAAKLQALQLENAFGILESEKVLDAPSRAAARGAFVAALKLMDDYLASRTFIPEETIGRIQATSASGKVKNATIAAIKDASAQEPQSVRMVKATRAFMVKNMDLLAHFDKLGDSVKSAGGKFEFAEPEAAKRHEALLQEIAQAEAQVRAIKR